jgi:hypothetical protein
VERQRRRQDNDIPVLQRAMKLKQRKLLEQVKGNPFDSLQFEKLKQIANDIHLKFGKDSDENKIVINSLVEEEQKCFNTFAEENLEVLLPNNHILHAIEKPEYLLSRGPDIGIITFH